MIPAGLATILALLLQVSTITVKGQVLNGQTREPLSGVEVYFGAAGKRMMSTATDGEGRFSLAVPEGTYSVSLKKPGYVPPRAAIPIGSDETGSVGLIDIDDTSRELHFKMIRGGVITDRVFEPDGRPAAQKKVSLKQRSYDENGVPSMSIIAGSTVVDDRGEYRFFGIEAGDYYLSADSV